MGKSKKNRVNVVYSTNPDFDYDHDDHEEEETLPPSEQQLKVWIDKKQRAGKEASIVKGFVGSADDLKQLAKEIKQACGTGGSAKDGEIIIQGDKRDAIVNYLIKKGYKAKKAGG
ncbi:translation initiation factor [Luteibaculum oceani]|uniref:Translation initiation factor n=1 Tax=Luteibaculum oceani TaxID=1294296 RepID=A0A5C6VAL0_9FLAO|nr:translation initiation factor [Luteibaculum oceani]TXC81356.1 translation initiation factor [Luteibaculum oceani]